MININLGVRYKKALSINNHPGIATSENLNKMAEY